MSCALQSLAPCIATLLALGATTSHADTLGPIFYIAIENHNWTQPVAQTSPQQLRNNPAAPFINSLVTPGHPNAQFVSYASNYQSLGASVHPSLPNYIWHEAGTNFGVQNDNDPYALNGNNQTTHQHLCALLNDHAISWLAYQEDIDVDANNIPLPRNQWISPISSFSGTRGAASTPNAFNATRQYNYAAKHNPAIYFSDTNGGNNSTSSNPAARFYAPLQQLSLDLAANTVARYNFITPNQFNDMHSTLSGGFTYNGTHYTSDPAAIAQGDNFLSIIVPQIMASSAFQTDHATIVIWTDETVGGDDASRTMTLIIISKLAKGNAYNSTLHYTHSSDLKTLQELFGVAAATPTGFLGAAATATDLADLFIDGALPRAGATTLFCPADFDADGFVDLFDYDVFVTCFEGAACPPGKTADFDHDGSADFFDYDAFVTAFEVPC